jgi:oligopeptide transport system ATP-binding protein
LVTVCATRSTSRKREVISTLSVDELHVSFTHRTGTFEAVAGASLRIEPQECVGIVGESGSGKTQLFLAAMGLLGGHAKVSGSIRFAGNELLGVKAEALNRVRGSKLTMIFQDPMTSLTPHLRIGTQLAEVLVCHLGLPWREARSAAGQMLEQVRIPDPKRRLRQYPYELSGGMRQRVMLAMSLLCKPDLLIADEPTTALDVTLQAQIMELLRAARDETGMALVLISHDLAVIAGLADRILVMYAGTIVENAAADELLRRPRHPYTAELLKCVPSLSGPRLARMPTLAGQPPQPGEVLPGCSFAPRCPRAADRCRVERPALTEAANAYVACHFPLS